MTIFASMLSGDEYVVNAREKMLEAMCGCKCVTRQFRCFLCGWMRSLFLLNIKSVYI